MNGFRNLYKVFNETRRASREQATVAVLGEGEEAEKLARAIGAQRNLRKAEILLNLSSNGKVWVSGRGVEDVGEVDLGPTDEASLRTGFAPRLAKVLEEDYLVPLAKGYPLFRRAVCEELTRKNARQNAIIGALPIPGADMPVMTANQARMVLLIAAAYGEELSLERARELAGVLAAGFGLRAVTRQVLKFIPVGGWAAAAAVGYAGTLAMGRATMLYFERGHQQVGSEEMEAIRERASREAKDFVARFTRGRGR